MRERIISATPGVLIDTHGSPGTGLEMRGLREEPGQLKEVVNDIGQDLVILTENSAPLGSKLVGHGLFSFRYLLSL